MLSTRANIIKNLIAINASFLFIFASMNSVASIQPVLNQQENLGITSQVVIFAVQTVTCLVFPSLVLEILGFKWTMALAELFSLSYIGFQALPEWYTLMPTSILSGFAQSLVWTIIGIYVTILSKNYSKLQKVSFVEIQAIFFGVAGSILLLSYTLGSLLVGLVLKSDVKNGTLIENSTELNNNANYNYSTSCGSFNSPQTPLPQSDKTDKNSVYWLCGCLDILMVISLLITILFMDDIKEDTDEINIKNNTKLNSKRILGRFKDEFKSLIKLSGNVNIWLLLPITLYTGYELTFIWFEFNRAFAACLGSINLIGWANALFGILGCAFSFVMGFVLKYIGSSGGIILMLSAAFSQCIFVLSWTPDAEKLHVIYLMVVGFAVSQSIGSGQVRALYGVYFPKDQASFSYCAINQTIGLFLGSMFSIYFSTAVKTFIFIGIILSSLICFIILLVNNKPKPEIDAIKREENKLIIKL